MHVWCFPSNSLYATHKGPVAASWVGVGDSPTPSPLALSLWALYTGYREFHAFSTFYTQYDIPSHFHIVHFFLQKRFKICHNSQYVLLGNSCSLWAQCILATAPLWRIFLHLFRTYQLPFGLLWCFRMVVVFACMNYIVSQKRFQIIWGSIVRF